MKQTTNHNYFLVQGEPNLDYDTYRINKSGVSFKKILEDIMNNQYVFMIMSTL